MVTEDEYRGLRIMQAQCNPYSDNGSYTVDLYALTREDPKFVYDLQQAFNYISEACAQYDRRRARMKLKKIEPTSRALKTSESMKARWKDPEFRAAMMEKRKKQAAKTSHTMKRRWKNPEFRRTAIEGQQRAKKRSSNSKGS